MGFMAVLSRTTGLIQKLQGFAGIWAHVPDEDGVPSSACLRTSGLAETS